MNQQEPNGAYVLLGVGLGMIAVGILELIRLCL